MAGSASVNCVLRATRLSGLGPARPPRRELRCGSSGLATLGSSLFFGGGETPTTCRRCRARSVGEGVGELKSPAGRFSEPDRDEPAAIDRQNLAGLYGFDSLDD